MEKVLVLGNKGMLGHVLYETFQANDVIFYQGSRAHW